MGSLLSLQDRLEIAWLKEVLVDEDQRAMILALLGIGAVTAWVTAERLGKEIQHPDRSRRVVELARAGVFLLFIGSFLLPAIDPVQSARRFLSEVGSTVGDAPLSTYGIERPALFYLADRKIGHFEQLSIEETDRKREKKLEDYLLSGKTVYLLAAADEIDGLQTQFPGTLSRMIEIRRGRMGIHGEFVLLSSKKR